MTAYKKILFPSDLSEDSKNVAAHVKEMASKFDAEVHIVYVAHVAAYYSSIQIPATGISDFEGEIISAAEKQLKDLVDKEFNGFKACSKVLSGNPTDRLL